MNLWDAYHHKQYQNAGSNAEILEAAFLIFRLAFVRYCIKLCYFRVFRGIMIAEYLRVGQPRHGLHERVMGALTK